MSKSLVSFIRKELGWKGKTEHTGRGAWWMHATDDVTYDEKLSKVKSLLPKWREKGLVMDMEENEDGFAILFSGSHFDGYYRLFYVNKVAVISSFNMLGAIGFTFPEQTTVKFEV